MKKFLLVMFLVLSVLCFTSISFAAESGEDLSYIHEEIFKRILFDYNFLTDNTESESREIFNDLNNELDEQEITFLQSIGITQETSEEIVLFIQGNYDELIENKTTEVKGLIDKYLLTHSLKYYYNILGDDYEYQEMVIASNRENTGNQTRSTNANVVSLKVCSDPQYRYASMASTGLDPIFGHHSWIQVCNLTGAQKRIGGLLVAPYQEITIGTWKGNSHRGVYYNVEVFYRSQFSMTESVCAEQLLTQDELDDLNDQITLPANDNWTLDENCAYFAEIMWNAVADNPVSAGIVSTPVALAESILEDADGDTRLLIPTDGTTYYRAVNPQRWYGSSAE